MRDENDVTNLQGVHGCFALAYDGDRGICTEAGCTWFQGDGRLRR